MKVKVTVEVEFTDKGLADYREALWVEYGDRIGSTKKAVQDWLAGYAQKGILAHLHQLSVDPSTGDTLQAETIRDLRAALAEVRG